MKTFKEFREEVSVETEVVNEEVVNEEVVDEEVEDLDELSKETLSSYVQKAADGNSEKSAVNIMQKSVLGPAKTRERVGRKAFKRTKGIQTAAKKLAQ